MNQPAVTQPKVSLAQSSPTTGTFRERDGALEWSGRQETVRIEPWGPDAVRVRARLGGPVLDGLPGALLDPPRVHDATVGIGAGPARLTVGALTVEVSAEGMLRFLRTEDRTELLAEERAHFWWPGSRLYTAVGNGHHLPAGARWMDAWTGETYEGGTAVTVGAPLDRIPLFLRDGAELPIAE